MQTEDSGLSRLYVTTHLFFEGTILSTTRGQYTADESDEVVKKKMQAQHKTMLKRLRDGDFDYAQELPGRSQSHSPVAEIEAEDAPQAVSEAATQSTLRLQLPHGPKPEPPPAANSEQITAPTERVLASAARKQPTSNPPRVTGEVGRSSAAPVGPILAPVAPPPAPTRPLPTSGSLAERLRRAGSGAPVSGPPPIPGSRPAVVIERPAPPAASATVPAARTAAPAPVVEFEADLPDDEDDLEPAVTIEVVEPAPPEVEPTLMTYGLPKSVVPATEAGAFPAASLSKTDAPRLQTAGPAAPPSVIVSTSMLPAPAPAPVATRTVGATGQRTKATAEGVVLQRTLVPTPSLRPGLDSLRTTSPRARPTTPAPLAMAQSLNPADDERSLDRAVLAYLSREVRK